MSLTDHPERFQSLPIVHVNGTSYEVEAVWYHKGQPIFKFRGLDSISDAEKLEGMDVCVPESERVKLPEDEYFFSDLVGCRVVDDASGEEIGYVSGWSETGGPVLLEVDVGGGGDPLLVPFAKSILKKIDVVVREIRAELPPGLLELNR